MIEIPNFVKIGMGTEILSNCQFRLDVGYKNQLVEIGENCVINCNFIFESNEGEIKVGNNSFINGGTKLISRTKIMIGDYVTIGWGCTIYNHNSHSLDYVERQNDIVQQLNDYKSGLNMVTNKNWDSVKSREIIIHNNVWIGFESVILSGVTIGEGAVVGARSVVRENVEPWTVVYGNPAVVIKRLKYE
jgi:galactoside O-acetyltransferase